MVKLYQVGGAVRDKLMGVESKDIDIAVEASSYNEMRQYILDSGGEIYLEKPEFLSIRCNIPDIGAVDFTACRKDGAYHDGRHPESVEMGTIYDDLARRDFTMNAIAIAEDGTIIDPHGGQEDIKIGAIRCVGDPKKRFNEDALRLLRAIRFSVTKKMTLAYDICNCLNDPLMVEKLDSTSTDRIRDELYKCFQCDTLKTLEYLERFWILRDYIFIARNEIWLKPTTEE